MAGRAKAVHDCIGGAVLEHGPRTEVLGVHHVVVAHGREGVFLGAHDGHNHQALDGPEDVNGLVEDASALTVEGGEHDLPDGHEAQVPRLVNYDVMAVLGTASLGHVNDDVPHPVGGVPEPLFHGVFFGLPEDLFQLGVLDEQFALGNLAGDEHLDDLALVILDRVGVTGVEADHVRVALGPVHLFKVNPGSHDGSPGPRVVAPP